MTTGNELLDRLYAHVVAGEADDSVLTTREGLAASIEPTALLYDAMIPALGEVGRRFEQGEYFLPEMLIAAKAMQAAMDVLRPQIVRSEMESLGVFVMGTVAGDIHDVGKNLCNIMLEGSGFEVHDLGINVPAVRFVEAIHERQPVAVGMSAFLTTTMPELASNMELFDDEGVLGDVTVLVGGAPVDQRFADEIGAHGYAANANSAVRVTKTLLGL